MVTLMVLFCYFFRHDELHKVKIEYTSLVNKLNDLSCLVVHLVGLTLVNVALAQNAKTQTKVSRGNLMKMFLTYVMSMNKSHF